MSIAAPAIGASADTPSANSTLEDFAKNGDVKKLYEFGVDIPNVKGAEFGNYCTRKMGSCYVEERKSDGYGRGKTYNCYGYINYWMDEARETNIMTFEKGEEQKPIMDDLKAEIKKMMEAEAEKRKLYKELKAKLSKAI